MYHEYQDLPFFHVAPLYHEYYSLSNLVSFVHCAALDHDLATSLGKNNHQITLSISPLEKSQGGLVTGTPGKDIVRLFMCYCAMTVQTNPHEICEIPQCFTETNHERTVRQLAGEPFSPPMLMLPTQSKSLHIQCKSNVYSMHSCSAHKFDGRRELIKIEVDNLLDLDALTELNVSGSPPSMLTLV